jgi:hypothetical protein
MKNNKVMKMESLNPTLLILCTYKPNLIILFISGSFTKIGLGAIVVA